MAAQIIDMNNAGINMAGLDPVKYKSHNVAYVWLTFILFAFVLTGGWLSFENKRLSNTIKQLEINLDQARTAYQLELAQNQKILKHMTNEGQKQ